MVQFTPRLSKAINVATLAHKNQKRKGGDLPYIVHPFSVMCIAGQARDNEDILIACLFHDIIEDVPEEYSETQMRADFGDNVVDIVMDVTKDDTLPNWKDRADSYLDHLENRASDNAVIVSCADKIHNIMSILSDYKDVGESLWDRFNSNKEQQYWWYESILKVIQKRMPDLSLIGMLSEQVDEFKAIL